MAELHRERGKRLELTWFDSGDEIVVVFVRALTPGAGDYSASLEPHRIPQGRKLRAMAVLNPKVRGALMRRGWQRDGPFDLVLDTR